VGEAKPDQSAETQAYDVTVCTKQDRGGSACEMGEVEAEVASEAAAEEGSVIGAAPKAGELGLRAVPAVKCAITDAIALAERILAKIDAKWPEQEIV
jgi:hypothetical protein